MSILDLYFENDIQEVEHQVEVSKKLDIFLVLSKIENRDFNFYSTLDIEQQKSLSPYILNKWMSVVYSNKSLQEQYLFSSNSVNKYMFELGKHPDLLWKLLCSNGTKRQIKHGWVKVASNSDNLTKLQKFIVSFCPSVSNTELTIILNKLTIDKLQDMIEYSLLSKKDADVLIKEFKARK
jgi:hypothetical protein